MQSINWGKLLDLKYWLEGVAGASSITPVVERDSFYFWFYLYFFSTFLIVGIFFRVIQAFIHASHPFQSKLPFWGNSLIWMGLLGLLWFTFRQLSVGLLGARIWLIAGFIWFGIFAYFVIKYFVVFYKLEMQYFKKTYLKK